LKKLLIDNADVFAWTPSDMVGVPRKLSEHRLNVSNTMTPVAQKRITMGPERSKVVIEEVKKLRQAGIIREVRYETWIANLVLVQTTTGAGECVWTSKTSMMLSPKTVTRCPQSILK
jgi:hypothetical protein